MNQICNLPQFWNSIKISDETHLIDPYHISILCGKGFLIQNLNFNCWSLKIPNSSLTYLSKSCPYIVSLSLYLRNEKLFNRCPGNNIFPIEELNSFLTNSKYIRSLRFNDSLLIDDLHLVNLLPHLQMMRELDLSGCISLSDSTLIKLAQQCPSLQLLDISKLPITGRCIKQIFRYCNGIKIFRANYCTEIQNESFQLDHVDSIKYLSELSVIDSFVKLDFILENTLNLKSLSASYSLHDSILIPFLNRNKYIENLYIGSGSKVTISSLITTILSCGLTLKSLVFHPFDDFAIPSDEIMRLICLNCLLLTNLSLAHTQEISTYWIIEALKKLKLESLCLFGWKNANDSTLKLLIPYLNNLKKFTITGAFKITIKGLIYFLNQNIHLEYVRFEGTNANVKASGCIHSDVFNGIKFNFPNVNELSPGLLKLK